MAETKRRLWQRFWSIARLYWRSQERAKAFGMLALLVVLLLGQTASNVLFVEQTGEFTSALAAHDADRFWASIRMSVAILLVAVPIWAFYYYVRDRLGIQWRKWLTGHFLGLYFGNRAYYELNASGQVDNPDQRIAEDIHTFTQQSLYFLMVALGALIQLVAFTGVLWSISTQLVFFLIVYAIAGNVITTAVFGRRLIGINFQQLRREADFRFSLVRIRENAESIAFHRGEPQESAHATRIFDAAFANFRKLIRSQFWLNLFQYGFSFVTVLLPSAILASRVISGELEVGRAVQAAGAFAAVMSAMTVIVDHFEGLSRFVAGVDRLNGFARTLQDWSAGSARTAAAIETGPAAQLALEHLTLQTPGGERTLIRDLSLTVEAGRGLMIVGESGGGKSSLLRAVAGLWHAGSGLVLRPRDEQAMFLPQHPYMVLGSLREQLLYPDSARGVGDAELVALLARVNLSELLERFGGLDAQLDWAKVLSIGEQQRLAFARVLLAEPRYAMLDESTSALDADNEEMLYRELATTRTTPVSVSHRPALLRYHAQVLELPGDGSWRVVPADGYRFS